jgi:predicted dehydrogenase
MIWLVGTGPMARDYACTLVKLNQPFVVVGRDGAKASRFAAEFEATGLVTAVHGGGVEGALDACAREQRPLPSAAIVAVTVDALAPVAAALAPHCSRILLEKPGALEVAELRSLAGHPRIQSGACQTWVGYNRRYFDSIQVLKQRLATEGPVLSAVLEFDEPVPRIEDLPTAADIKARWGFANASHVFDLLFYLCGAPDKVSSGTRRSDVPVSWHPAGSVYVGAGVTRQGTQYVYHGNFASVGRWRLALSVAKKRYLLMPLETLQVAEGASVAFKEVPLPGSPHSELKPGLAGQVTAFLAADPGPGLVKLSEQVELLSYLAELFGYPQ